MNEIENMIIAARLTPSATSGEKHQSHDFWSHERVDQWQSFGPSDRGREFDARIARGDRLVVPHEAAKMRNAFISGTAGFEIFEASAPIFPLLVAKAAPTTPSTPIATSPAARPVPAAVMPKPMAIPVILPPRRETTAELYDRRRREASGETAAVVPSTTPMSGPTTAAQIFERRRAECERARLQHEAASQRGGSAAMRDPMPEGRSATADSVFARRAATVDQLRRLGDG